MQVTCDENFKLGFNRVYDKNLANGLRRIYKSHEHLFEALEDKGNYQLDLAANSKTIRDFDDAITRVSFGWPSVDAYYAGESSPQSLQGHLPCSRAYAQNAGQSDACSQEAASTRSQAFKRQCKSWSLLLCRIFILTVHPKCDGAPPMCTGDFCHSRLNFLP